MYFDKISLKHIIVLYSLFLTVTYTNSASSKHILGVLFSSFVPMYFLWKEFVFHLATTFNERCRNNKLFLQPYNFSLQLIPLLKVLCIF